MALVVEKNALISGSQNVKKLLKSGKLALYPTETCYGIGCIISSKKGLERVYEIKNRPKNEPVLVIAADLGMAGEFAVFSPQAKRLAEAFWPGPLTLLLERAEKVPDWFPGKKIAIRVPGNKTARKLCEIAGGPLVSTSANKPGKPQLYDFSKAEKEFGKKIDLLIDGGVLKKNAPSTLFDSKEKRVLREGEIKLEQIREVLEK